MNQKNIEINHAIPQIPSPFDAIKNSTPILPMALPAQPQSEEINWSQDFFDGLYYHLFMKRDSTQIESTVDLIESILNFKTPYSESLNLPDSQKGVTQCSLNQQPHMTSKQSSVFDVCCGVGDVAASLGRRLSIPAFGLDNSDYYIQNNHLEKVIKADARVQLKNKEEKNTAQGDQSAMPEKHTLVLNWFSSFSYFSPEDNLKILKNCYHLCSDTFILETGNAHHILNNFKPLMVYEKSHELVDYVVERHSRIDTATGYLHQDWLFKEKNNMHLTLRSHDTKSKLYDPSELVEMLHHIGFKTVDLLGLGRDHQVCAFSLDSPRLIIRAKV